MRQLPSKLVAGGLSAAVVLLWWPRLFPADSVESWLVRGFVWTLLFELMLLSLRPLECALWDTAAGRRLSGTAAGAGRLIDAGSPRRRIAGAGAVAALSLAAAAVALMLAPPHRVQPAQVTRHVTEVQRIVRVVKKPVQVVAQAPAPPVSTPAPVVPGRGASERPARGVPTVRRQSKPKPSKPAAQTAQPQHDTSSQQQPAPQPGAGGVAQTPVAG